MVKQGKLFAMPGGQHPLRLIAVNETTFTPAAFDDVTVTFNVEAGRTLGFELNQGSNTVEHKRVQETWDRSRSKVKP